VTNTLDESFILEPVWFFSRYPRGSAGRDGVERIQQRRGNAMGIARYAGEVGTPAVWRGCNTHDGTGCRAHAPSKRSVLTPMGYTGEG